METSFFESFVKNGPIFGKNKHYFFELKKKLILHINLFWATHQPFEICWLILRKKIAKILQTNKRSEFLKFRSKFNHFWTKIGNLVLFTKISKIILEKETKNWLIIFVKIQKKKIVNFLKYYTRGFNLFNYIQKGIGRKSPSHPFHHQFSLIFYSRLEKFFTVHV